MPRKLSKEEFVARANKLYGYKYDYSDSCYFSANKRIEILCPTHGWFSQLAFSHLEGKEGCRHCTDDRWLSNFIVAAQQIHGRKYDYRFALNKKGKASKLICPEHGIFWKSANQHLAGSGCPDCWISRRSKLQGEFIAKAAIIHSNKYDYSLIDEIVRGKKLKILCPLHGEFLQTPETHLNGRGCRLCGIEGNSRTMEEFLEKASAVHGGKYDYSLVKLGSKNTKIQILCPSHGIFEQLPGAHLYNQSGCPKCTGFISKKQSIWLDNLGVPKEARQKWVKVGEKKIRVDAFDELTNTVYEFLGDYWHGNPAKFKQDELNKVVGASFGDLFYKTQTRLNKIKKAGFKIQYIWEEEFDRSNQCLAF